MRVLWVVKGLGPGGAERLLVSTAQQMAALAPDITITCAFVVPVKDHLAAEMEAAGVRTVCLSARRRDPAWVLRLRRLVDDADVVHVHSPLVGAVARVVARSRRPRPALVTTEHNAWSTFHPATRVLNRLTIGGDDAVLAVSEETASSMSGRAARRVRVVHHGIDLDRTRAALADRLAVRAELGLAADDVVVCCVANFRVQKDHPTLLRAMQALPADSRVRVVLVGQGPLEAETRELAAELGVDPVFTGFRADAVRVLAAADVFTLSSSWEGLPVALMEATALGLPVVATRVGGVAETMTDGVDALLVPPGDPVALGAAWQRVALDDSLRSRLAAGSGLVGGLFDACRSTAVLVETYRSVGRFVPIGDGSITAAEPTPTRRGREPVHGIRAATDEDIPAILDLMASTLGWQGDWARRAFRWKHLENPFGRSPLWVVAEDDRILAVRALLRWRFRRGDEVLHAVRAVDTATHPDAQGRGLFRSLTLHALDQLDDVDFVFNTPNDQSRPGYLSMGWVEVGRIAASVIVRSPSSLTTTLRSRCPADLESAPVTGGVPFAEWWSPDRGIPAASTDIRALSTDADADVLRWRYGSDLLDYRVVESGETAVVVRARRRGQALELVHAATFGPTDGAARAVRRALALTGADHAVSLDPPSLRDGRPPLPGVGPTLTFRGLRTSTPPPLPNWCLAMGDVELF